MKGGLNIAGHKIPWTAIGAVAAVVGAFLVWRFNQSSGGGLSAGAAAPTSPDIATDPVIQNLTQEIAQLQAGDLGGSASSLPPPQPHPPPWSGWNVNAGTQGPAVRGRAATQAPAAWSTTVRSAATKTA